MVRVIIKMNVCIKKERNMKTEEDKSKKNVGVKESDLSRIRVVG